MTIQSNLRTSLGEVPVLDHSLTELNSVICRENSETTLLKKHVQSSKSPTIKKLEVNALSLQRKLIKKQRKIHRQKECLKLEKYLKGCQSLFHKMNSNKTPVYPH